MKRNGKKRKKRGDEEAAADGASSCFNLRVFPILLAAAARQSNSSYTATLAARLLRRELSRSRQSPSSLPDSLVALLPLLLSSSCCSVAALSCEVLGAAALQSMEAGETLASDSGIANGLARALGSRSRRVVEAACNAVMDLLASSGGREHLAGSPVLLRIFLNQELVRNVLPLLFKIQKKVQVLRSSTDYDSWKNQLQSREYEISEAIFRLSMDLASPACLEPDVVRESIFGQTVSDVENFVLAYWEKLPILYKRKQITQNENLVFAALHNAFDLGTGPDAIIESLVKGLVSCPAIASDELNISSFLQEVRGLLGVSARHRQDLRVVRTREPTYQTSEGCGVEEHFFDDEAVFLDEVAFVEHCKNAFKNGYSIALRGMEFRSEKVAAISSALADLFGQPSVGANIYFSPARSQGLARHYDDHCVLVWQLLGCKKWVLWSNPKCILPRLYEPFDSLDGILDDNSRRLEVLFEGDMMYIPRGYVHEAHTSVGVSQANAYADYSLHLTLAIEVEPPFEWEGFIHIALHCWMEKQKAGSSVFINPKAKEEVIFFALMLHVAIRLLSISDPTFRKACMVAAKLPSAGSSNVSHLEMIRSSQRSTFDGILRKIDENCIFKEALKCIELTVKEKNDEPFQWMSWLRHLPQQGDVDTKIDFCNILRALEELLEAFNSNSEQFLADFTSFKSRFCRYVAYEDACESFELLLQMYRTTRNQYMRGMLGLHGAHVS
ncbi:hypothetical protein PR202_gb14073 [Eleusine coracana subsp. coracana]|uniref:Bifunctional lysine-specific demethylase and histidyl-hydroxylase n=1 Tax=Eleusine coracana subsp. coracana TaxID=191504 RepID=A0AAV5ETP4_ELECO|nr:hypothetical protein PR202_gb14073 [Eleusine coracana subsp. coracana]